MINTEKKDIEIISKCCNATVRIWVGKRPICNNCGKECEYTSTPNTSPEKKSFHDPCPYGNDECPTCNPTHDQVQWNDKLDELFGEYENDVQTKHKVRIFISQTLQHLHDEIMEKKQVLTDIAGSIQGDIYIKRNSITVNDLQAIFTRYGVDKN